MYGYKVAIVNSGVRVVRKFEHKHYGNVLSVLKRQTPKHRFDMSRSTQMHVPWSLEMKDPPIAGCTGSNLVRVILGQRLWKRG